MGVNFLSYASGDTDYEGSPVSVDSSSSGFGFSPGLRVGYRFAEHYEAGLFVAVKSLKADDFKQREESIGAYGSYHFVGRESSVDSDLSWFVGLRILGASGAYGGLDERGSVFGVFGGPEYALTETASISAQAEIDRYSGEIESNLKVSRTTFGLSMALNVWLPVSVDKAPAGPSRRR
jgi:hypothetical protein